MCVLCQLLLARCVAVSATAAPEELRPSNVVHGVCVVTIVLIGYMLLLAGGLARSGKGGGGNRIYRRMRFFSDIISVILL